jgi:hypothetical protein
VKGRAAWLCARVMRDRVDPAFAFLVRAAPRPSLAAHLRERRVANDGPGPAAQLHARHWQSQAGDTLSSFPALGFQQEEQHGGVRDSVVVAEHRQDLPAHDLFGRRAELVGGHLAHSATQELNRVHLPFGNK